jgi:phosphate-selective porin
MKKLYSGIAIMAISGLITNAKAQDVGAQIDALQNEILKMKEQMSKGSGDNKAYFKKGKGLSIKSSDGKYEFKIGGRMMYDLTQLVDYESGTHTMTQHETGNGFGAEFRRLRFDIKGKIGNGWAWVIQPDFAEGSANSKVRNVVIKDAFISKSIKGVGKFSFGNVKSGQGLYENTSSNNLIYMERPLHNEMMNFAQRMGIVYDTSGALGKQFHAKMGIFSGLESGLVQPIGDSGVAGNADNESEHYGASIAVHYHYKTDTPLVGGPLSTLFGYHFGYLNMSGSETYDTNSARANGVHTFVDKPIDIGNLTTADTHTFHGPQLSLIFNDALLLQTEYQIGKYTFDPEEVSSGVLSTRDDYNIYGGSIGISYAITGKYKHSGKKGAVGGLKCKRHCFVPKYQYEWIDANDFDNVGTGVGSRDGGGGAGQVHTMGFNHYFNSNVRAMFEYAYGEYDLDNARGAPSDISTLQARLHLKW